MYNKDTQKDKEPLSFSMDGTINEIAEETTEETTDDVVVVPRAEYAELVSYNTLMYVVSKLVASDLPAYTIIDVLNVMFSHGGNGVEKPAEPETSRDDEGDAK